MSWTRIFSVIGESVAKANLMLSMTGTDRYSIGTLNRSSGKSGYFNGQIDDVRIYNYGLTTAQVKDIYNGGAVNFR